MKFGMRIAAIALAWLGLSGAAPAQSIAYAPAISTGTVYAVFNGNSPHIASNKNGTVFAYQLSTTGTSYASQREILAWWSGDPLTTSPVTLLDVTDAANPLCVASTSSGEFWAAYGNWITNTVSVYRWADPTVSTTPTLWSYASDQAQNGKWSCAYDEMRRKFYFIGTGMHLLTVDDSGTSTDFKLTQPTTSSYAPEYPNIQIGDDGYLDLAWVTVDTTVTSAPQYRSIQYMQSPNGGKNWSVSGLSGSTFISVPPSTTVVSDESGPSLAVYWFGEMLTFNTWLSGMAVFNSQLHFTFSVAPSTGERCLDNVRCTVADFVFDRHPSGNQPITFRPVRADDGSIPHAVPYTQLVVRGGSLYLLAAGTGSLVLYKFVGGVWKNLMTLDPRPVPANNCVAGLTAEIGNRGSASIVAAVAIVNAPCSAWSTLPLATSTDLRVFRITL